MKLAAPQLFLVPRVQPGGATSAVANEQWLPARKGYFVPVKALSTIFRAKFRDFLGNALPNLEVPRSVWRHKWVVYVKPAIQGVDNVLAYLGRYVHRIAISNSRIVAIDDGKVTFRYKDSRDGRWRTMALPPGEFIRRFLQHVLPRGVHKVRYYGLWAPSNRKLLRRVQVALMAQVPPPHIDPGNPPHQDRNVRDRQTPPEAAPAICRHCHLGVLRYLGPVLPDKRAPPL